MLSFRIQYCWMDFTTVHPRVKSFSTTINLALAMTHISLTLLYSHRNIEYPIGVLPKEVRNVGTVTQQGSVQLRASPAAGPSSVFDAADHAASRRASVHNRPSCAGNLVQAHHLRSAP